MPCSPAFRSAQDMSIGKQSLDTLFTRFDSLFIQRYRCLPYFEALSGYSLFCLCGSILPILSRDLCTLLRELFTKIFCGNAHLACDGRDPRCALSTSKDFLKIVLNLFPVDGSMRWRAGMRLSLWLSRCDPRVSVYQPYSPVTEAGSHRAHSQIREAS
jgi:hypothetical protein